MKKYLMMATALTALAAASNANAGMYIGMTGGLHHAQGKLKLNDATKGVTLLDGYALPSEWVKFPTKSETGMVVSVMAGWEKTLQNAWMMDMRVTGSYDTTKLKLSTVDETANDTTMKGGTTYKPEFGVGLGFYFGRMLSEKVAGYFGVHAEMNFAKVKSSVDVSATAAGRIFLAGAYPVLFNALDADGKATLKKTDNVQVFSLTPSIAFKGKVNEKMGWLAEVGYKMAVNVSNFHKPINITTKTKPHGVVAKVGVTYHF